MIQSLFSSAASAGSVSQSIFQSIQRVASGQRINQASDDAAGLGVLTSIDTVAQSDRASLRAINDGMNMLQGVDGAAEQIQDNLVRMRELSMVAASDTTGPAARAALQEEADQLYEEIRRVAESTEFAGVQLTNGAQPALEVQAGPDAADSVTIDTPDLTPAGLALAPIDLSSSASAQDALDALDAAVSEVGAVRGDAGAQHERLASASDFGASRLIEETRAASIFDTDIALEAADQVNLQLQWNAKIAAQVQSQDLARSSAKLLMG